MYAVIKTGGKQYRVAANDVLEIERLTEDAGATVEFTDVRRAADAPADAAPHVATFRTFDGLVVTFRGYESGEQRWLEADARFDATLAARFPPAAGENAAAPGAEQVAADAERLSRTAGGWRYEVPAWKFDAMFAQPAPGAR